MSHGSWLRWNDNLSVILLVIRVTVSGSDGTIICRLSSFLFVLLFVVDPSIMFVRLPNSVRSSSVLYVDEEVSQGRHVRGEDVREENVQDVSMRCFFSLRLFK